METPLAPQQDRSVRTQQALLDSLDRLLQTHPFDALTVSQIAAEAGLTTGAIYRRFKDKRALLEASFKRFVDQSVAMQVERDAAIEDMSDPERVEYMIRSTLRFTIPYIPLMRAASALNDQASFEHMRNARNIASDWLSSQLRTSSLERHELERRTRFAMRTITAVIRDTLLAGPGEYPRDDSTDKMVQELSRMTSSYLEIDGR